MSELLFEIGCEEIPARVVPEALAYLAARAAKLGDDYGLPFSGDARVYGSPSTSHPPSHASNSPNGRNRVAPPRRGEAKFGRSILEFFVLHHSGPASSITTRAPARVSAYAVMPPPAPEPMMQTSNCWRDVVCRMGGLLTQRSSR